MSVLLTRPLADSQRIAELLSADGIASLIWPLTKIVFRSAAIQVPQHVDGLVFSSANAVAGFVQVARPSDVPVYCVGDRTAAQALEAGFSDVRSADGDYGALVDLILRGNSASVLYLRGQTVTGDLCGALAVHGLGCESRVVYAAEAAGAPESRVQAALEAGSVQVITVWSRRNAGLLNESLQRHPGWDISETVLIGISDNAVADLGNAGFRRIIVASRPNATQMVAEIRAAVR